MEKQNFSQRFVAIERLNKRIFTPIVLILLFFFSQATSQASTHPQLKRAVKPQISAAGQAVRAMQRGLFTFNPTNEPSPFVNFYLPKATADPHDLIGTVTLGIDGGTTGFIPPDPIGAAGPSHAMYCCNSYIEWYTKDRTNQYSQTLATFFSSLNPEFTIFDPRCLYDMYNDRYVVIAVDQDDGTESSNLYIAVSDDSDPNGTWYYQKINTVQTINDTTTWLDYPTLGVGEDAIYVTGNMFAFVDGDFKASLLWIIDKGAGTGGLYDGGSVTFNVYDPWLEIGGSGSRDFTLQPARMRGTPPDNAAIFLYSAGWYDSNTSEDFIHLYWIQNPTTTPVFSADFVSLGDVDNEALSVPNAPQPGVTSSTQFINTGGRRAQSCMWRDNVFWGANTINPKDPAESGQATVLWFGVNTSNLSSLSTVDKGIIGAEDLGADTYTFYPAITANQDGDVAIGFAASGANVYAGAYYTVHINGDAAGTVRSTKELKAGEGTYYQPDPIRNRWGDYSGIGIDPADDLTFWFFNEYAEPSTYSKLPHGDWRMAFGHAGTIEDPSYFYADNITSTSLVLHWSGRSAEFEVTQDGSTIYTGSDTTLSVTGLTANTTYQFVVRGKSSGENYYSTNSITLDVTTEPSGGSTNPVQVASATLTYQIGEGTTEFTITKSGVALTFPSGVTSATYFTAYKKSGDPGIVGSLPAGITTISRDRNWTVVASAGTSVGSYNIKFDLTGVSGITNFNTLHILKRDNESSAWQDVETDLGATVTRSNPYITVSGLSTLSDFAIASVGDNPLPVSLSSFQAIGGNGEVFLHWTTESEVNNLGFIIEKATSKEGPFQELASYEYFPELKGQGNTNVPTSYQFTDNEVENNKTYYYRLINVDLNGWKNYYATVQAIPNALGDKITQSGTVANRFELLPNYPNPFNPETTIKFSIPSRIDSPQKTQVLIYDALGKLVGKLFEGNLPGGVYELRWNGKNRSGNNLPSGIYFILFHSGEYHQVRKIMLVR